MIDLYRTSPAPPLRDRPSHHPSALETPRHEVPGRHLVRLVTWLPGVPLARVAGTGTEAERNRLGELYQRFLLSGPARCGLLHTDPHPGNFRLTPDGRLGVLDFGSCLALPGGLPRTFGRLITALRRFATGCYAVWYPIKTLVPPASLTK